MKSDGSDITVARVLHGGTADKSGEKCVPLRSKHHNVRCGFNKNAAIIRDSDPHPHELHISPINIQTTANKPFIVSCLGFACRHGRNELNSELKLLCLNVNKELSTSLICIHYLMRDFSLLFCRISEGWRQDSSDKPEEHGRAVH